MILKEDLGTKMLAVKAEPDIFWQERQWHTTCWESIRNVRTARDLTFMAGSAEISYLTVLHQQLPLGISSCLMDNMGRLLALWLSNSRFFGFFRRGDCYISRFQICFMRGVCKTSD